MLTLLLYVLFAAVVLWAAGRLLAAFSVPEPIGTVIYVIVVIVVLWWFLGAVGIPLPRIR